VAFDLSVVTPEGAVLELSVDSVVAPGSAGEFGVLTGHEAFLAPLSPGLLRCSGPGGDDRVVVTDGFAEVGPERVVVMVDRHVPQHEIDVAAARSAQENASAELERIGAADDPNKVELEKALARANAELDVADRG